MVDFLPSWLWPQLPTYAVGNPVAMVKGRIGQDAANVKPRVAFHRFIRHPLGVLMLHELRIVDTMIKTPEMLGSQRRSRVTISTFRSLSA